MENAQELLTTVKLSRYQIVTLLRTETSDFETMVNTVTIAVGNAMNSTILEGQVSQAIDTIKQIAGYSVQLSLMQNIVPTVLRTCVKPNMVIDQEQTEAAREAASDAVEPVMCLQGQCIIREGDVVTAQQQQLLSDLGLLSGTSMDYTIYVGAFLLVTISVVAMVLLQLLLDRTLFSDVRRTSVVMLILVLNTGVCTVIYRFANLYIAPVVMGSMLITCLLGWECGIPAGFCMSMLAAGLASAGSTITTSEVVQLLAMNLVGVVVSARFLTGKAQRMRMVLCGLLIAVTDAACSVSIGLMTSFDIQSLLSNMVWYVAGAILSGIIALGLQPVFEAAFNLATPSKLQELSNPEQPLLRKLLIEAPGTYHHSIIVANLAEAAAERIGANPALARTASYYHDVGKLKRPLYFKENQVGENLHDSTDPYVSAAIVTSHTRDGVALAQKYRLPPEIQDIILEHHGDTPVMFFYHKACQMNEGKTVNIDDFRYDGRRPTTKEAAILMLADTVEAAVRSMPDPTPEKIRAFIEKLVRGKLDDGQLSNAPLTLRDIQQIIDAFCTVLHGVFHERIEYPNVEVPHRSVTAQPEIPTASKAEEPPKAAEPPKPAEPAREGPASGKPAEPEKPQAKEAVS